jgi:formylglycine-generating enzyme required for sulfatase activity
MAVLRNLVRVAVAMLILAVHPGFAEPLDVFRDCDVCPEMIELPLGEFVMGAPEDEFRRNVVFCDGAFHPVTPERPFVKEDEGPQHQVKIDIPIAIGRNEVTYAEWMACVDDGGCRGYIPDNEIPPVEAIEAISLSLADDRFGSAEYNKAIARAIADDTNLLISGNFPVVYVSYPDAQLYVDWLNTKLSTDSYRLPTEAEWEYAARAGTTTRFAQGDEVTSVQANFSGEDTKTALRAPQADFLTRGFPAPVGELDAGNAWGIRHTSGNVSEITLSCYSERYAGWSTSSEWLARSFAKTCDRSVRGGSYAHAIDLARVAWRFSHHESLRSQFDGFRVLRELD